MKQDHRGNRTRISKSPFPPEESKSKILRGYCGDYLPLEVLFRLNRLDLWPNDPVRGRRHIRGRSTKVEVEIALQEELKDIYNRPKPTRGEKSPRNNCPRWLETSLSPWILF